MIGVTAGIDRRWKPSPGPAWEPLLTGSQAEEALACVYEIAVALGERPPPGFDDPSLAGGSAGLAVLFNELERASCDPVFGEAATSWLAHAVRGLPRLERSASLLSGFTGVGWALTASGLPGMATGGSNPLRAMDRAAAEIGAAAGEGFPFDLTNGLTGLGVYFLERPVSPQTRTGLRAVIDRLEATAEVGEGSATWRTSPAMLPRENRRHPGGYYDLGLAHGVPGVIAFLALVLRDADPHPRLQALLSAAVSWLLAQRRRPESLSAARFSSRVGPGVEAGASRLAWCYGDLGIAAALLGAAQSSGDSRWAARARSLALRCAARPFSESGVRDAGLCHGSAGVAHLFNRLYQATRDPNLREAACRWFARTIQLRQPGERIAGYRAWSVDRSGRTRWRAEPGFLEGAAGVALALLSAATPIEPRWDRPLLVAWPGPLP